MAVTTKYPKGIRPLGPDLWRVRHYWRCPKTGGRVESHRHVKGTLADAVRAQDEMRPPLVLHRSQCPGNPYAAL